MFNLRSSSRGNFYIQSEHLKIYNGEALSVHLHRMVNGSTFAVDYFNTCFLSPIFYCIYTES